MLENCYKFLGKKYEPVLRFLIHTIAIRGWNNFNAKKLLQIFGQKYEPVLRFLIHAIEGEQKKSTQTFSSLEAIS